MSTQTVSNAVARRSEDRTAIDFMLSKRSHLRTVLPKSIDVDAFVGTAAGALYASDVPGKSLTLMKCAIANPDSLYVALMEAAALGHLPGTDEYYLTPRTAKGRLVVVGIEGYKGVVERMYRSGAVANVIVREVCENDYFLYVEGEMDKPVHKWGGDGTTGKAFFSTAGKRGEMVGGYAYAHLLTGSVSRVALLSRDDVLAARDSGGYRPDDTHNPWNRLDGGENHPEFRGRSMWWKTFAKRLEPWVPTSAEWRRESLRASASASEHAISQHRAPALPAARVDTGTGEIIDAEIVDTPDVPPAEAAPPSADTAAPADAGGTRTYDELLDWISARLAQLGVEDAASKLRAVQLIAGKHVKSARGLNHAEAVKVADTLDAIDGPGPDGLLADLAMAGDPREQDGDRDA